MAHAHSETSLAALEPLVGEWRLVATFKDMPPADIGARVTLRVAARRAVPDPALGGPDPGGARRDRDHRRRSRERRATTSSTTSTRAASPASTR